MLHFLFDGDLILPDSQPWKMVLKKADFINHNGLTTSNKFCSTCGAIAKSGACSALTAILPKSSGVKPSAVKVASLRFAPAVMRFPNSSLLFCSPSNDAATKGLTLSQRYSPVPLKPLSCNLLRSIAAVSDG